VAVTEERPSFDTRAEAEEYCREREREDPAGTWLAFEADGRWTAVRTDLPRHADPSGSATESKPKPSPADDPRSAQQRSVPWPGGGP
jgi:hypothetical protein